MVIIKKYLISILKNQNQSETMKQNLKAFTLVEVLVSIAILGIIFSFLFQTTSSTKKLNQQYIDKSKIVTKESIVFNTLMLDISQSIGGIKVSYGKSYDIVRFKTKNSVYDIIEPYVTYLVSKKDSSLLRTESLKEYNLDNKTEFYKEYVLGDILLKNVTSFKLFSKDGFVNLMLRAKDIRPIVIRTPRVK